MKYPHSSISGLVAVVLIVALDFGAGKALRNAPFFVPDLSDLHVCGALPMATILAIGPSLSSSRGSTIVRSRPPWLASRSSAWRPWCWISAVP